MPESAKKLVMNLFDNIIGYETIRKELERTADALKNVEYYARLGASAPRGLLLYGDPGVGKTLMATSLIKASGRKSFTCRKDHPDGEFIHVIRKVFDQAVQAAPSIIFLDDLDKFANNDENHRDSEEYVTVQSCIDAARGSEVFVLATVNELDDLPESLIRAGRFDRIIRIDSPTGEDAAKIVQHYLAQKSCVSGIDPESVAGIMAGYSCADLETAVNKAGLLAGYERAEEITMRHLVLGCLDIAHRVSPDSIVTGRNDEKTLQAACHEAGHALVSELLFPVSVSAVCIYERFGTVSGFTSYRETEKETLDYQMKIAIRSLAGRAASMHRYGVPDLGSMDDINSAQRIITNLVSDEAAYGFGLIDARISNSPVLQSLQEQCISSKMEDCFLKAARLIAEHRDVLDAMTDELTQKGFLVADDVRRIVESSAA